MMQRAWLTIVSTTVWLLLCHDPPAAAEEEHCGAQLGALCLQGGTLLQETHHGRHASAWEARAGAQTGAADRSSSFG